jgi:hypothetical protein
MEDDSGYIVEEEPIETREQSSNRPFLTAVGVLLLIFILAAGCSAFALMNRGGGGGASEEVAAIETQNAIIAVTNAAVTQTIAAMETEAARPTDTPTPPPPTFTPQPAATNTPKPTNTPVVADGAEDVANDNGETPNESGTSVFDDSADASTPTPIPVGGNNNDALPDTGFELWTILLAAVVLVGLVVMARRMRSA